MLIFSKSLKGDFVLVLTGWLGTALTIWLSVTFTLQRGLCGALPGGLGYPGGRYSALPKQGISAEGVQLKQDLLALVCLCVIAAILHPGAACPVLQMVEPKLFSFAGPVPAPRRDNWAAPHPRVPKPEKAYELCCGPK